MRNILFGISALKSNLLINAQKEGINITEDISKLSSADIEVLIHHSRTARIQNSGIGSMFLFGY